jgi:hypothetical protein
MNNDTNKGRILYTSYLNLLSVYNLFNNLNTTLVMSKDIQYWHGISAKQQRA